MPRLTATIFSLDKSIFFTLQENDKLVGITGGDQGKKI